MKHSLKHSPGGRRSSFSRRQQRELNADYFQCLDPQPSRSHAESSSKGSMRNDYFNKLDTGQIGVLLRFGHASYNDSHYFLKQRT